MSSTLQNLGSGRQPTSTLEGRSWAPGRRTLGCLFAIGIYLFCASEPAGERPRLSVEGRLAGLSREEQRALGGVWKPLLEDKGSRPLLRGGETPEPKVADSGRLRRSARTALAWGHFDDAIAFLEAAAAVSPDAAELESDLAAARLSRGLEQADPREYFLALKAAQHALRLDPDFLPAQFNRALALTQVGLLTAAEEAWTSYLAIEQDPAWQEEARARSPIRQASESDEDLQKAFDAAFLRGDRSALVPTVLRSPRWFREQAEEVLLPAWGAAMARGDEPAAWLWLQQVEWISEGLAKLHESSILASTVRHIGRSRAQTPEKVAPIAIGMHAYGQGLAFAKTDQLEAALAHFDRAGEQLSEAGSPFALWPRFRIALCHYQRYNYVAAQRLLKSLAPAAEINKDYALHGRAMVVSGLIELIEGDPAIALGNFQAALKDFQELSEPSYQAKLQALIANCFDYLGQRREAWRWLHAALVAEQGPHGSVDDGIATHWTGSGLALEEKEPEIALLFQEQVLRAARTRGRSAAIVDAQRGRASILEALGRPDEAQQDLLEARTILTQIGDKQLARGIEGDLAFIEGRIALDRSPGEALELFDQAIEIFRTTSYRYRLVLTLIERARLLIALDRPALAERDLADAISESERQRLAIDLPSHRMSYFDQIRTLLDMMVDLQMHRLGRPRVALEFSERARARVLWDWLKVQSAPVTLDPGVEAGLAPAAIEAWHCELPASSLVVEYAVLPDKLVIWWMKDCGRIEATTVEIGAEPLRALVKDFRRSILQKRPRRSDPLAEQLYDLLIRPFGSQLEPGRPLVLIPDGPLQDLPFSLLKEATAGRRLLEDHALSMAPSLRILAAGLQRDRDLAWARAPRALIVTAPAASPEFEHLAALESAEVEAKIADVFPGSRVLSDRQATKAAFLSSSREFEILHFGGHSIVNTDSPLLSYLVLAPDSDDPAGVLYSRDLLRQRFPAARLVVLASCESGLGKVSTTEGVESLARPFLAAGVPGVIASLWPVEDRSTAEFFVRFYQKLATTWDVAEALRETQNELLEVDPSATKTAGAFIYIGTAFTQ